MALVQVVALSKTGPRLKSRRPLSFRTSKVERVFQTEGANMLGPSAHVDTFTRDNLPPHICGPTSNLQLFSTRIISMQPSNSPTAWSKKALVTIQP